ncbi:endonuclease/exonuclease/phosphatase family protein [Roseovarius spongiae]|uniref:Endonuclease/exonuclease/phosphatase family protein n=1 Tax=Roseovarius spongiae TaxID=2320272 RepID=A0A3A8B8B7_9RHOB|nr:endonuclease/exonuclease/phosphatase family protein [Roseovarius spongiae]RKF13564.1 endonuclease/exonuclease/phosphatase family protein [Roseovarius spongiae]
MLSALIWILAAGVFVTTALPLTNSVHWWIRMWEFPRLHIAAVALALILLALPVEAPFKPLLLAGLLLCLVYQVAQIYPYLPFAPREVELIRNSTRDARVCLLAANVQMENRRHADLARIIDREDPDVLLLMETDAAWDRGLSPVLDRYATVRRKVTDDYYGMIFATRLPVDSVEWMYPSDDDTPAIKAVLREPGGSAFNFIGLHPRPPVPGNDTKARDEQIRRAAEMTSSADRPTACMGDFNDVAWSWTTRRFKRYGSFAEPRVGRGMVSSFHADYRLLRLPIDQFFLTPNIGLVSFERLEDFGSDHFPLKATITFEKAADARD